MKNGATFTTVNNSTHNKLYAFRDLGYVRFKHKLTFVVKERTLQTYLENSAVEPGTSVSAVDYSTIELLLDDKPF